PRSRAASSEARHRRIFVEHRPERLLQWPQPRLEVAPMIDAITENRFANLLRAGGAHRAVVLVEAQTAGVERQGAVLRGAAHLAFRILDHGFVVHAMDPAWQH